MVYFATLNVNKDIYVFAKFQRHIVDLHFDWLFVGADFYVFAKKVKLNKTNLTNLT